MCPLHHTTLTPPRACEYNLLSPGLFRTRETFIHNFIIYIVFGGFSTTRLIREGEELLYVYGKFERCKACGERNALEANIVGCGCSGKRYLCEPCTMDFFFMKRDKFEYGKGHENKLKRKKCNLFCELCKKPVSDAFLGKVENHKPVTTEPPAFAAAAAAAPSYASAVVPPPSAVRSRKKGKVASKSCGGRDVKMSDQIKFFLTGKGKGNRNSGQGESKVKLLDLSVLRYSSQGCAPRWICPSPAIARRAAPHVGSVRPAL